MGNLFGAFQSEVFRPFATLLIPGSFALATWFVGILSVSPAVENLVARNHTETGWLLAICVTCAGLIIEDLGARYEFCLDKKAGDAHAEDWFRYLRTSYMADPIGRRYLRGLVLRLKFELGMAAASISSILGMIWLLFLGYNWRVLSALVFLAIVSIAFFVNEAHQTHKALARTRNELLKGIIIVGSK